MKNLITTMRRLRELSSLMLLSFVYALALILILSALRAQQIVDGQLTINFEYRVF